MMRSKCLSLVAAACASLALGGPAHAEVRVGFMAAMTGPLGITGQEMKRGLDLAMEHLGGRLGGQEAVVVVANDQASPTTAVTELTRLVEREKVSIVLGIGAANVAMALVQPTARANVTLLLAHAGPNQLAGKDCAAHVFGIGHQNEQFGAAIGRYMKQRGLGKVYGMSLDYQGGWDNLDATEYGLGQSFSGKALTAMTQVDFAPEFARVRSAQPEAIFAFYPGNAAVAFVRQYAGAGLKQQLPLFSVGALVDSLVLKAQGDAALGLITSSTWNAQVRNEQNDRFTRDFKAKNGGREPTTFSAQTYDTVMYLDAALRQTNGSSEPKALREALRNNTGFKSIRGAFRLNKNQFPVQDMIVQQVDKDANGDYVQKIVATMPAMGDRFASQCPLN